jgi:V/A-type H+-transporting ATPase subunit E
MGLEKIRQAVLAEAKAEATRIIDSARKKNADSLKLEKEAAEQEFERLCKLRMQAIEEDYSRKLIQLKGTAGKRLLDKRNALLKSLFERAKQEILTWPPEKYGRVMEQLIERAAGTLEGKLRVHPDEGSVFERILKEMNKRRGDANITLDQTDSLSDRGGFIFVSVQFEVDHTLDTMLKEIEHDLLPAIAADLFARR